MRTIGSVEVVVGAGSGAGAGATSMLGCALLSTWPVSVGRASVSTGRVVVGVHEASATRSSSVATSARRGESNELMAADSQPFPPMLQIQQAIPHSATALRKREESRIAAALFA